MALVAVVSATSAGHATRQSATRHHVQTSFLNGATLQRADCADWLAAGATERANVIRTLGTVVGAQTEYRNMRGTALTQSQAYDLFDSACSRPFARGFLLYLLYARAAGFGGAGL